MHSFKDLDVTDTEIDHTQCPHHHNDIIKVCLQGKQNVLILAGCEQLKLCKQCLSVHNPSHKEISIYQLFRDVSNKVKSDQKIEKNKEKFDIVFKHIQEMRIQMNLIFNQLENDIKQYLKEKINVEDLNNKYNSLISINEHNYIHNVDILKLYYENPSMFFDGQLSISYVEDTVQTKLLKLTEKLRQQIEQLKNDAEDLFEVRTRKVSEQRQEDSLQLITTINGHDNVVRCIIRLQNGDFATSSRDKTIKIWNQQSFQCVQILKDHINWVQDLTLLPDNRFASCSDDKSIKIFSQFPKQNNPTQTIWECVNTLRGHESYVVRIVYNDQFNCLITCSTDGTLRLWDPSQKHALTILQGHENCVYTLATSKNLIVSGDEGGFLIKWSLSHNKIEKKQKGHSGCVNSILIHQNIFSCGDDKKLNIWDQELQFVYVINFQRSELESLQFINDELIIGGDEQGYLQFINPILGKILFEIPVHNDRIYKITHYDGVLCTVSSDLSAKIFRYIF